MPRNELIKKCTLLFMLAMPLLNTSCSAANPASPKGQDGLSLPSDWYLQLTGAAKKAFVGRFVPNHLSLPISP